MKKFKIKYIRNVIEIYEVVLEAKDEINAEDTIYQSKYGEVIEGEKLIEKYSDDIEIDELEEIK